MKNKTNLYISLGLGALVLVIILIITVFFTVQRGTDNLIKTVQNNITTTSSNFNPDSDLFGTNASLECKTIENGKEEIIYFKEGSMARKTDSDNFVLNNSGMYIWENSKTEGVLLDLKPENIFNSNAYTDSTIMGQSIISSLAKKEDLEDFKKSCKTTKLDDSLFSIPSNVKFQSLKDIFNQGNETSSDSSQVVTDPNQYGGFDMEY